MLMTSGLKEIDLMCFYSVVPSSWQWFSIVSLRVIKRDDNDDCNAVWSSSDAEILICDQSAWT